MPIPRRSGKNDKNSKFRYAVQPLFENRTYRTISGGTDLVEFSVTVKETNLFIRAESDLTDRAYAAVMDARNAVERYIASRPEFSTSLVPIEDDPYAPPIVREMIRDSSPAGVGPMAAVAGAIAEFVARRLSERSRAVIVENGGDVFMISKSVRVVGLYADDGGTTIGMEIGDAAAGRGISSSSAVIGRSLSLGKAELATVVARGGALSDAAATALGNRVTGVRDIEPALADITGIPGVQGAMVLIGGKIGAAGDVKLVALRD
jgi:ApbE superfamily uncharacterized protein (UPF0280 family)